MLHTTLGKKNVTQNTEVECLNSKALFPSSFCLPSSFPCLERDTYSLKKAEEDVGRQVVRR